MLSRCCYYNVTMPADRLFDEVRRPSPHRRDGDVHVAAVAAEHVEIPIHVVDFDGGHAPLDPALQGAMLVLGESVDGARPQEIDDGKQPVLMPLTRLANKDATLPRTGTSPRRPAYHPENQVRAPQGGTHEVSVARANEHRALLPHPEGSPANWYLADC
jgi:hypothetical protein